MSSPSASNEEGRQRNEEMTNIENQIYDLIIFGEVSELDQFLSNYPASLFSSETAGRFLGKAVASRMVETVRVLLNRGFLVTDMNPYDRLMPSSLGHEEMARLLQ